MTITPSTADLLVLGGGMAGMSAAAFAAQQGLRVLVTDPAPAIGGSSGALRGTIWTAASEEAMRAADPGVDLELGRILIDEMDAGLEWIASLGVEVPARIPIERMMGFASFGSTIDVSTFMSASQEIVRAAGGNILTRTTPVALLREHGRVVGARLETAEGRTGEVRAPGTLLATGGYQGDAQLRREHIGAHAEKLVLRSNPYSTGGGLRLALSAGGVLRPARETFYGHLFPYPLDGPVDPAEFSILTQFYSPEAVLLNEAGERFVDEFVAYYGNALAVAKMPRQRALLVADDRIRQQHKGDGKSLDRNSAQMDRVVEAGRRGAHVAVAPSLAELEHLVRPWGYRGLRDAVEAFNAQIAESGQSREPGRRRNRTGLLDAPYFAVEVQPSITFTFRGLATDSECHLLDRQGEIIPGLLASGADACFYNRVYFGGLSLALVFGLRAVQIIMREI